MFLIGMPKVDRVEPANSRDTGMRDSLRRIKEPESPGCENGVGASNKSRSVSYTHLTLPTSDLV